MIKNLLLVAAGGGIGAALRYLVALFFKSQSFPWSTLLVNVAGSFALGIILALSFKSGGLSSGAKLFLATGLCGGFTTFSTFSVENFTLMQEGKFGMALIYITASILAGILAAWFGFKLIHQ
jgi:fluoride exporter